jgi:hypothetical protein
MDSQQIPFPRTGGRQHHGGSYGIEAIRYFSHARAAGVSTAGDFRYSFNRGNGFYDKLSDAGHTASFYFVNTDVWETDIRDADQGGEDSTYVDTVDICWIDTHGNHTASGAVLLYDTAHTDWRGRSQQWQLGEAGNDLEWLMVYACDTVNRNNVNPLGTIFGGLHIYCGAYDLMWDSPTTDECGEDVGDNLVSGDTVSYSWMDGVSDWAVDNHPITVCPADAATWNNGNVLWERSILNRDHLHGHGNVEPDLPPSQWVVLLYKWSEG